MSLLGWLASRFRFCSFDAARYSRLAGLVVAGGLLFSVMALPVSVGAQQTISLASLQIGIWPEFDRPSTLVILDGQVAPGVTLPAQVSVRMPAAAKQPNAVAVTAPDGTTLVTAAFTTVASGGDIIVRLTTTSAGFRVEYYDPGLEIKGDARAYAFRWQSDYAIDNVSLKVQEPYGARDLALRAGQPALTAAGAGTDGLNYYTAALGALPAGGTVSFDLSYSKTGSVLSATAIGSAAAGAGAVSTPAAAAGRNGSLPLILGSAGLGLALVAGGVTWYLRGNRSARDRQSSRQWRRSLNRAPQTAVRQPAPAAREVLAAPAAPAITKEVAGATLNDAPSGFCTQCGQRHQPGDLFCRRCGTPVRA